MTRLKKVNIKGTTLHFDKDTDGVHVWAGDANCKRTLADYVGSYPTKKKAIDHLRKSLYFPGEAAVFNKHVPNPLRKRKTAPYMRDRKPGSRNNFARMKPSLDRARNMKGFNRTLSKHGWEHTGLRFNYREEAAEESRNHREGDRYFARIVTAPNGYYVVVVKPKHPGRKYRN